MIYPLLATIVVIKIFRIPFSALGTKLDFSLYTLMACLLPLALIYLCLAIGLLFPRTEYAPFFEGLEKFGLSKEILQNKYSSYSMPPIIIEGLKGLLTGVTINMLFAFGEEIGWRGLLYHVLRKNGFWRYSLIIGFLWGLWHIPLTLAGHNYPQHPYTGTLLWVAICICMSPIFTFLRDRTGSVITAAIFHGGINGVAGIATGAVYGGNDLIDGISGVSGLITFSFLNIVLYFYLNRKKRTNLR
jgi:membrane protease YdiL (CAAX protease family)